MPFCVPQNKYNNCFTASCVVIDELSLVLTSPLFLNGLGHPDRHHSDAIEDTRCRRHAPRYLSIYNGNTTGGHGAQQTNLSGRGSAVAERRGRARRPLSSARRPSRPRLTLIRSRGCVQHAAPHDASPPKYHRDIRFSVMVRLPMLLYFLPSFRPSSAVRLPHAVLPLPVAAGRELRAARGLLGSNPVTAHAFLSERPGRTLGSRSVARTHAT